MLKTTHTAVREALDTRIQVPTLAGLVLAETVAAAQREITLAIDESSYLRRLPAVLSDTQVVTIVGNLLDNAFDAVANMPLERRHVRLLIAEDDGRTLIEVSDRGEGLPSGEVALFDRGVSTKAGHEGLGLALVGEAVTAARGTIEVERQAEGSTFRVTIDA